MSVYRDASVVHSIDTHCTVMSVYRDAGAVHSIDTHCTVMTAGRVNVLNVLFCVQESQVKSLLIKILAKKKVSVLIFSCDILLC